MENKTQKIDFESQEEGAFGLGSVPRVEVERTFNAPVESLWKAWTTPELVKQWWGPETYSCPEAEIDLRKGGKYLFAMKGPDGRTTWSGGTYLDLAPYEKIECTDQFMDEDGDVVSAKAYGMSGEWPETLTITVHFEDIGDDRTEMKLVHEGIPAEMHDDCVEGWSSSINKLQRLVEKHS